TIVFAIFFGRLAGMPSDGAPYALFALAGLVPWAFFAQAVSQTGGSLVGNQNLVSKVYFPRLVIPISSTLAALVDTFIATLAVLAWLAWEGRPPDARVLWLPAFTAL